MRNEQFQHIGKLRKSFERRGCPVLSIDTKQKELLGNFFRKGHAYTNGQPLVLDHDFPSQGQGRLVPYGVYDVLRNEGLMLLSIGHDTSALACDAIWRWWQRLGQWHYAGAKELLFLGQQNVVRSRHPGRYPKLEGSTLSYPAFEPLTEHHALVRACSTVEENGDKSN